MKYSDTLAQTIMRRFPDPDTFPYQSWSYSQGFMLWGFIRLYENTGNEAYYQYVSRYGDEHVDADGQISGFSGVSLDDIMAGSVLVWLYTKTNEDKYRIACERIRRAYDDYPRNSDGGFWHARFRDGEMWVDGLFMGLMFLTRYGQYIGDADYCFAETVKQLAIVLARCEKQDTGLLYHAYCEHSTAPWAHPITGQSPEIWSEGLGWYAMILAEVLALMPETVAGYDQVRGQLRKLVESLAIVQDKTSGLWYQVVDKGTAKRNWHDTSGSAMFVYTIKKSVLLGLIDEKYNQIADMGFAGIKTKYQLDPEGSANIHDACDGVCVQLDYDAYVDYARNVNSKEAVAAVLWAAVIMEYGVVND